MSERENNVYKAKLAEQAERYDGELKFSPKLLYFLWNLESSKRRRWKNNFFINGFPRLGRKNWIAIKALWKA